ncbi:MAG: hypothetical protein IKC48_00495 [Clostridia bacterium]|nr:hypothetical protein [Clostridia bacterium]
MENLENRKKQKAKKILDKVLTEFEPSTKSRQSRRWNPLLVAVWNQCKALYGIKPQFYTPSVMPYDCGNSIHAIIDHITVHNDGRLMFTFRNGSEETVMM